MNLNNFSCAWHATYVFLRNNPERFKGLSVKIECSLRISTIILEAFEGSKPKAWSFKAKTKRIFWVDFQTSESRPLKSVGEVNSQIDSSPRLNELRPTVSGTAGIKSREPLDLFWWKLYMVWYTKLLCERWSRRCFISVIRKKRVIIIIHYFTV